MTIPANSTNQSMVIMLQNVTSAYEDDERFIGQVYEITKTVEGQFLKPITLEFQFDPKALGDNEHAAVFYYDEEEQRWIELDATKLTGENSVQGETDHFTKFAVLAVKEETIEPEREEPAVAFSDIDGHWAQSSIIRAARSVRSDGFSALRWR